MGISWVKTMEEFLSVALQPGCVRHGIHTDTRYPSLSVRVWIILKSSTPQCLSSVYSKPRCCGKGKVHVRRQTSRDAFFPLSTILMEGTNLWNRYQLSSQSQSVVGVAMGCLVWRLGTSCPETVSKNKPILLYNALVRDFYFLNHSLICCDPQRYIARVQLRISRLTHGNHIFC